MNNSKKKLLLLQKAFDTCCKHYQAMGYSEEHCKGYVSTLSDERLLEVYDIICQEQRDERE